MMLIVMFTFVCRGCVLARSVRIEAQNLAKARALVRREFPEAIHPTFFAICGARKSP